MVQSAAAMRLIGGLLLAVVFCLQVSAQEDERWFTDEDLAVEQAIDYEEFEKTFYSRARSTGFTKSMEEYYRIYARECHNYGGCKKWTKPERSTKPSLVDFGCPEQEYATEPWPSHWDTGEDADIFLNNKIILLENDLTVGNLVIAGAGKLIFKGRLPRLFNRLHVGEHAF